MPRKSWKAPKPPKPKLEYSPAPEVEKIAREIIREHHKHLVNVQVRYVFRSIASKKNGRVVLGTARKVTGMSAYLANVGNALHDTTPNTPFCVIEIAKDQWANLNPSQQKALVDHELCHLWVTSAGKISIRHHDVEEFREIIIRHGLWQPELEKFGADAAAKVKQHSIDDELRGDDIAKKAKDAGLSVVAGGSA